MSTTTAPASLSARRRSAVGALLGLLAWLALIIAPIAAQAMTRIDPGVPGAIICSVNKADDTSGQKAAMSHCQLCTLAQQSVGLPPLVAQDIPLPAVHADLGARPAETPPARAPPRAHPPRAPPLS